MLPSVLKDNLRLPVIASPLFIISHPQLTLAQCKAGVIGAFPALNARPESQLDEWLAMITEELAAHNSANPDRPAAPFAVNQIVHMSNRRLEHDLGLCVKYKVPVVISSLGAVPEVNAAVHSYGGIVLHDIINNRHAKSAIRKGADGLIAVATGAGGHAGASQPLPGHRAEGLGGGQPALRALFLQRRGFALRNGLLGVNQLFASQRQRNTGRSVPADRQSFATSVKTVVIAEGDGTAW